MPLMPAIRTDLFFGTGRVGPAAWARFVSDVITPRFSDGLTVLEGRGQWHGRGGLIHEPTRVVVLYHRNNASSGARIEDIRTIYERRFHQTSVLRADSSACIGF